MPVDTGGDPSRDATGARREEESERPQFAHPQWMVGVVLVFAVVAIVAGFESPIWWLIGAPCILTLFVWIGVRLLGSR